MKFSKKIFCAALFVFSILHLTAENWYVCLGSFKIESNAEKFSSVLEQNGLSNIIASYENAQGVLYRVLYERSFEKSEEAWIFRNGLQADKRVRALGISGLWICKEAQAEKSEDAMTVESEKKEEPLQKNEEEIPVSEEKPYSLKVRSYKEQNPAQQSSERLRENKIDAYVVKTYDDKEYFSFDVHAGAFASPDESAEIKDALEALGIEGSELSEYSEIKEKMKRYDEVIQNEEVVFEDAEDTEFPEFSASVRACLSDLPVNKNFFIESIKIIDFDFLEKPADNSLRQFREISDTENARALAKAVYYDDLFRKRVEVSVAEGDFSTDAPKDGETAQFALPHGDILDAVIFFEDNVRTIFGLNKGKSIRIEIKAHGFSEDEFSVFMNNAWSDSASLIYPQLRKSLRVFPKAAETGREFVAFTLEKVDESYAEEKGFADWAIPIVGHWKAEGFFLQENESFSISFFDMDYDHNARRIHGMFMDAHQSTSFTEGNHPASVNGVEGWYVEFFG